MKRAFSFYSGLLSLLVSLSAFAQVQETAALGLYVPRLGTIYAGQGTLDTSTVIVRPKGMLAEVSLYLTYHARNPNLSVQTDSMEIVHSFTLPEEASFVDSWLWMEDNTTIVRATILDVASAGQIYENIVRRTTRRDPSILYKRSETQYELRIFPVKKDQRRRIKLTYLVPYRMTAEGADVPLSAALLTTSRYPVTPVVIAYPEAANALPVYPELPGNEFRNTTDPIRGAYAYAGIPSWQRNRVHVRFPRGWPTGARIDVFPEGQGGYYALSMPLTAAPRGRHVVVGVNLAKDNLRYSFGADQERVYILDALRKAMQASLTPVDSFQLVASRTGEVLRVTQDWMAADTASIRSAIGNIGQLADTTRLEAVLPQAIALAQSRTLGTVLIVNASDAERTFARANQLLGALPTRLPRIDIFDVASYNRLISQGGRQWAGNEYLDQLLTQRSGGIKTFYTYYFRAEEWIRAGFGRLRPWFEAYDVSPSSPSGVAYARFETTSGGDLGRPYMQVGRYLGAAPTAVRGAGSIGTTVFDLGMPATVTQTDSTLRQLWWSYELRRLEAQPSSNATNAQILQASLRERVLTKLSAFLALEPSLGGIVCLSCIDESRNPPVSIDGETAPAGDELRAFPNPFRSALSLRVTLTTPAQAETITAEIFDVLGRRVRRLAVHESGLLSSFTLTWDGQNDAGEHVAPGAYVVVVTTPNGRLSERVTRLD